MRLWTRLNVTPHENYVLKKGEKVDFQGAMVATWTDNFDCKEPTEFWYCIKDNPLDIYSLNSNRRYKITKGNRNFTTKVICPRDYAAELYTVYTESLKGYPSNPTPAPMVRFERSIESWSSPEYCFFGTFDNESGKLCGYSDVWLRYPYLAISSFKTIPEFERAGVNISLLYGICTHFEEDLKNGAYLCDGSRNSLHETNFQDYLVRYFGFRRAYCNLHLAYRWYLKPVIALLYPIRKLFKGRIRQVYALLKMEAWSRGICEE